MGDSAFKDGERSRQVERLTAQVALFDCIDRAALPAEVSGAIVAFLDDQPVGPTRERRQRPAGTRLRPGMRLTELFTEWRAELQPTEQTAHEYEQSLNDFVAMHGDFPVGEIIDDDLLDSR